jgi:hypothetical protein
MTVALDCLCIPKFWRWLCLHFPGVDMKILVKEKESKAKLNDRKIVTENIFVLKYLWINNIKFLIGKIQGVLSQSASVFYCTVVRYFQF